MSETVDVAIVSPENKLRKSKFTTFKINIGVCYSLLACIKAYDLRRFEMLGESLLAWP